MLEVYNMRPGEKVIKVIRVHWISYLVLSGYALGTILISTLFYIILGFSAICFLAISILWMIALSIIYIQWLNFELDLLVVTNTRIIGIEQIAFLNRRVSECNLAQVQEVNSQTKGLFSNIFNYGYLGIQTAGNITSITMFMCPDAIHQARDLLNIVETYKDEKDGKENTKILNGEKN